MSFAYARRALKALSLSPSSEEEDDTDEPLHWLNIEDWLQSFQSRAMNSVLGTARTRA